MDFIEKISEESVLFYNGKAFYMQGKVLYTTKNKPDIQYYKVFLSDHRTLMLSLLDDEILWGEKVETLPYTFPPPDIINYANDVYVKIDADYQVVKSIEFGKESNIETDVEFFDFINKSSSDNMLSLGQMMKNHERADILLKKINKCDVIIKGENYINQSGD